MIDEIEAEEISRATEREIREFIAHGRACARTVRERQNKTLKEREINGLTDEIWEIKSLFNKYVDYEDKDEYKISNPPIDHHL